MLPLLFLLPPNERKRVQKPKVPLPPREVANKVWFFLDQTHEQKGPVGYEQIEALWKKQALRPQSYVWEEDLEEWQQIQSLPLLHQALNQKQSER